jgi:hypothetical protein
MNPSEAWKEGLQPSSVDFMTSIIEQVPEAMGARSAFVTILNRIHDTVDPGINERLKKLDALEAGGVDNWENYDFAMEDAGLTDEDGG